MLSRTACCGLRQIDGLSNHKPKEAMKRVCRGFFRSGMKGAFIAFTEASYSFQTESTYGKDFKKFIEKNKLGDVTETKSKRNPNSGNKLITFVWAVKPTNLKNWYKKNK